MLRTRLFNVFVCVALAALAALTIRQVAGTTQIVSAAGPTIVESGQQARSPDAAPCTLSVADRSSLRAVYVKQIGSWLPRTDSGFTGVEGGALYLLSQHDC